MSAPRYLSLEAAALLVQALRTNSVSTEEKATKIGLGPAATAAASTGRTRDRTRPMLQKRQKALARAPSIRDPKATWTSEIGHTDAFGTSAPTRVNQLWRDVGRPHYLRPFFSVSAAMCVAKSTGVQDDYATVTLSAIPVRGLCAACASDSKLVQASGPWSLADCALPQSENRQAPHEQRAGGQRHRHSSHY